MSTPPTLAIVAFALLSPALFSPALFSPALFSPALFSPALFSPALLSPALFSPALSAPPRAPSFASPRILTIDPVHSCALFRVRHMGAGYFWGRFNSVTGTVTPDGEQSLILDVAVAIDSVDSGNDQLDAHLKSPDFFNGVEFPSMTFKSSASVSKGNGAFEVSGTLTIRNVSKEITVPVESFGGVDGPRGFKAGYEATFTIKRSEFGVSYGVEQGALGDDVRVIVGIEAGEPSPRKPGS